MPGRKNENVEGPEKLSPAERLERLIAGQFSNLAHCLKSASKAHYGGFSLTCRSDGGWYAVGRGADDDMNPVVAFGSGPTWVAALVSLNQSIAKGYWKPDRFAKEKGLGPP